MDKRYRHQEEKAYCDYTILEICNTRGDIKEVMLNMKKEYPHIKLSKMSWDTTIYNEETKRKRDMLMKHPDKVATKELKKALSELIERYSWWIEFYEKFEENVKAMQREEKVMEEVSGITQGEILSEV